MNLKEKIEKNKELLAQLESKKANIERNIDNLKRKIENQEFALAHSKKTEEEPSK